MTEIVRPGEGSPNPGSPFDALRRVDADGRETWSARDLMAELDYESWRNFQAAIERAKASAENSGSSPDQFVQVAEVVAGGNLGPQTRIDYSLTRFAAYLLVMNGDPTQKPKVKAAQRYFAIKTREAEARPSAPALPALPQTYAEALRELAASVEEREVLAGKVAELAPAAESWNVLATANGDESVADAAKILSRDPRIKLGERRLFTVLSDQGWIFRQRADQRWRVYQSAIDTGRLMELPQSHYHPRTGQLVLDPPQVRVTVKGMEWLLAHLTKGMAA